MAVVQRVIRTSPERIFSVLADGWTYSDWVVGTAHIRDVDANWPSPGAQIHHKAGLWPVHLKDKTVSLSCDPPTELVMQPHLWPWGEFTVRFALEPINEHETRVELTEEFAAGPLKWTRNKIDDLMLHYRNKEALRRLADIAERRPIPS
jgi:hypothetical protein